MLRRFEIHELHVGFILVLFIDSAPKITLTGISRSELAAVGFEWANAGTLRPTDGKFVIDRDSLKAPAVAWDGIERRSSEL